MNKRIIVALCSASTFGLAAPSFAQTLTQQQSRDEATWADDAIIVTARRREESVQDVPLVVNTVNSEEIGKLNFQSFTEVQSLVPGLQLQTNANGIGANAQIRGVQFDINASVQPTVEFYLNDAVATADAVLQQMYDVAQIEVLRGPQGTLRGRSSPSGSITITTRKPDLFTAGGNIAASANTIGGMNFSGGVGVPLIEGVAAIRIAGAYSETEVNRVRTINGTLDGRDPFSRTKAGRITLLLKPVDWLHLEGSYHRLERTAAFYGQYASASLFDPAAAASPVLIRPGDRLSINEVRDTNDQTFETYNWRAEVNFAGQALIYQGARNTGVRLATGTSDPANRFAGSDFPGSTSTHGKGTSHELRLQNVDRVLGMFDYVIGAFRNKSGADTALVNVTPIALPAFLGGRPCRDQHHQYRPGNAVHKGNRLLRQRDGASRRENADIRWPSAHQVRAAGQQPFTRFRERHPHRIADLDCRGRQEAHLHRIDPAFVHAGFDGLCQHRNVAPPGTDHSRDFQPGSIGAATPVHRASFGKFNVV